MPKFLEKKLKKEYPNEPDAPYKILNAEGFMHGNKETKKGRAADKKHTMSKKMMKHGPNKGISYLGKK